MALIIPNYLEAQSQPLAIGEYWFDEITDEIFTFRTMLHPVLSGTNYKILYPEVSKFHKDNPLIQRVYPRNDSLYVNLSAYSFFDTGFQIDIKRVDEPLVSFNKETKTFVTTFLGSDIANYKYLFTYYLKRGEEELFSHNIDCIKPDLDTIHYNFTDWARMSGEFIPSEELRPRTGSGDFLSFETALTAQALTACDIAFLESPQTDVFAHGQQHVMYVGDRNDGMNTIWLGCSSAEYSPGLTHPFPVMYNTTYALPQGVFNKEADIEVYAEMAVYHSMAGESVKAVYSSPTDGWITSPDVEPDGTYTSRLTTFEAENSSGVSPNFKPGNGFSIFFYDADYNIENLDPLAADTYYAHGYNFTGGDQRAHPSGPGPGDPNYPITNTYPFSGTGFYPGGVGESLGYKPYRGRMFWDPQRPLGLDDCLPLITYGLPSAYVGIGFDIAGGFAGPRDNGMVHSLNDPNAITVASGPWNQFEDLTVMPVTDRKLYQELSGQREYTLEFPVYKVSLEECGTRVRVGIRPNLERDFIEYVDYKMSTTIQSLLPSATAIKVGMAFSTSDKTVTCELRSLNTYGRYITNPIFKTTCHDNCSPKFDNEPLTQTCPVTANLEILRTEQSFTPIITEGYPLGPNGLNYITSNEYAATAPPPVSTPATEGETMFTTPGTSTPSSGSGSGGGTPSPGY